MALISKTCDHKYAVCLETVCDILIIRTGKKLNC